MPTGKLVAIYGRLSTMVQAENNVQSVETQTVDLVNLCISYGWEENQIRSFFQDFGLSGTLSIEDREGMSELIRLVRTGTVGAVVVWMVDRLFRDEDMIDVNVFIKELRDGGCNYVITQQYTYDLSDNYDRDRFRDDCTRAWEDYKRNILGRLQESKQRASASGLYDGRMVAFGYSVDRDKASPTFKRFIPHHTHADIIRQMFERVIEVGYRNFCIEMRNSTLHFPDTVSTLNNGKHTIGADGAKRTASVVPGGWCLSNYHGIIYLLSNRVYIGEWSFSGGVRSNNHTALVTLDLFEQVQEELARNKNKRVREVPHNTLLLRGIVDSGHEGWHVQSGMNPTPTYRISRKSHFKTDTLVCVEGKNIDTAICERFLYHAEFTEQLVNFQKESDNLLEREKRDRKTLENKIKVSTDAITGLAISLGNPTLHPAVRASIENQMNDNQVAVERMTAQLSQPSRVQSALSLHASIQTLRKNWHKIKLDTKQGAIQLATNSIVLTSISPAFVTLEVDWKLWGKETCYIYRHYQTTAEYTAEEAEIIRRYLPTDPNRMLELMPTRYLSGVFSYARNTLSMALNTPKEKKYPKHISIESLKILKSIGADHLPDTHDYHTNYWIVNSIDNDTSSTQAHDNYVDTEELAVLFHELSIYSVS